MATVNEKMTAIAENIRSKTGGTEALTLDDMVSGVNEVFEAGKKAEYNEFWDNFEVNKSRTFAGQGWNKKTFRPNRDFKVQTECFYYHNWLGTPYDLAEQLENLGVKMTLHTNAIQMSFRYAWFTRLPELDFSKCNGYYDRTFNGNTPLVTIDKIILPPEGSVSTFNAIFGGCKGLKNITFEGVIDKTISFSDCPLSVASMKNIISCLKDYAGTTSEFTYSVTFSSACISALEAEGATAEYNGVACTWVELANYKKWNI